tara:strand:- start:145 stop:627 length:483 start_codon:yes stop_codon:yes gene_type:complete
MRPYCLIGLGDIKGVTEDLKFISETEANFVCGDDLLIATFMSSLRIIEMEEFFKMNERSFIIFELTPGFFSAHIDNPKFQNALFGGLIKNRNSLPQDMDSNIIEFMKNIKDELNEDELQSIISTNSKIEPTLDEILDKINEIGVEKLSEKEKQLLHKYSN